MTDIEAMRSAMVERITSRQPLSPEVAEAMRTVPRHVFVPSVSPETAYIDDTVITRRDEAGIASSSASAPWLVGKMLDQLDLAEGQRVLEVGGGTGYNAALIGHMVGESGHVTAVEIQGDVADEARTALDAAGVTNVEVVTGDGEYGHPAGAPFDRIIATAGAWDIPQAWGEQLAPGGLLVVPLRLKGLTRAIAFTLDSDGVWRSASSVYCGFMPIQGAGAVPERNIRIADDIVLRFDDGHDIAVDAVAKAATSPGVVKWTGITIQTSLELLDFYLADAKGFCRVLAPPSIAERGMAEPLNGWGSMGIATPDVLGYLTKRVIADPYVYELGACAYGTAAEATARDLIERIQRWERENLTDVAIEIHPTGADSPPDALMTVDKRHSRIIVRPVAPVQ